MNRKIQFSPNAEWEKMPQKVHLVFCFILMIVGARKAPLTKAQTTTSTTSTSATQSLADNLMRIADASTAINAAYKFAVPLNDDGRNVNKEEPSFAAQNHSTERQHTDGDVLLQRLWLEEHQMAATSSSPSSNFVAATRNHQSLKVLSRKRRYLIFPEGSSFQLVYDGIYGVVDYTNYLILGITVALAWELPSKAPSEILADLQDQIVNGKLAFQRRNDTIDMSNNNNRTYYIDRQSPAYINSQTFTENLKAGKTQYYTNNNNKGIDEKRIIISPWRFFHPPLHKKHDYYRPTGVSRSRFVNPLIEKWQHNNRRPASRFEFPWWHAANGNSQRRLIQSRRRLDGDGRGNTGYYQYRLGPNGPSATPRITPKTTTQPVKKKAKKTQKKHHIYPIYGKRRRRRRSSSQANGRRHGTSSRHDGELDKLDRIHIRHHRWTRQTLYGKIEKYLDRRGSHGHHCVLRALCETSQRSVSDREPLSFVAELMRALFTLPEPEQMEKARKFTPSDRLENRYDAAQAYEGDCGARYRYCKDSLWQSHFLA